MGKRDHAVRVLSDYCSHSPHDVVELAMMFDIKDGPLWDSLIAKAAKTKDQSLLVYSDIYSKPERFIEALSDETTLDNVQDDLMIAFAKLQVQESVLSSALKANSISQ